MVEIIEGERVGKQGRLAVGCSAAVFNDQQKILLIKRTDNGMWAVPGGYMEASESLRVLNSSPDATKDAQEESEKN